MIDAMMPIVHSLNDVQRMPRCYKHEPTLGATDFFVRVYTLLLSSFTVGPARGTKVAHCQQFRRWQRREAGRTFTGPGVQVERADG